MEDPTRMAQTRSRPATGAGEEDTDPPAVAAARPDRPSLAAVVKRYRLARKWSQGQLALYSGLSRSFISKLEQGQYQTAEPPTLQKIAVALQAPLDELLTAAGVTTVPHWPTGAGPLTDTPYSPVLLHLWGQLSAEDRAAVEGYAQALWDRTQRVAALAVAPPG